MPFNGKTKKRRKLSLDDFSRCNPAVYKYTKGAKRDNNKNGRNSKNGKKCLPLNVFKNTATKLQLNTSDPNSIIKAVGCREGEEHCFLDKAPIEDEVKKELRKQYLRPKYPKQWLNDPDMWLDNYNIGGVMKQYEEAVPWFKFLGVFPIDFSAPNPYKKGGAQECLYKELCTIDLKRSYADGVRAIGAIFNLDPHYKGGSHWVGLYINMMDRKKPSCSYFDSYGYKTPPMIARLMRSLKLQMPELELGFNARRFQFGGSECGMFSMYFIICMIAGIPFRDFCKDAVNDDLMLKLRQILFAK
jgi:Ulp1 protease family, C-terminal catalytic domain